MFREIKITRAMNGFVVKVGCQTVVFEHVNGLVTALIEYAADPSATEKRWAERYGYKTTDAPVLLVTQGSGASMTTAPYREASQRLADSIDRDVEERIYRETVGGPTASPIRGVGR